MSLAQAAALHVLAYGRTLPETAAAIGLPMSVVSADLEEAVRSLSDDLAKARARKQVSAQLATSPITQEGLKDQPQNGDLSAWATRGDL